MYALLSTAQANDGTPVMRRTSSSPSLQLNMDDTTTSLATTITGGETTTIVDEGSTFDALQPSAATNQLVITNVNCHILFFAVI